MLWRNHSTLLAFTMGGIVSTLKRKRRKEIIAKLKKKMKCNYYHEKGHWTKECEKKKEDKKKEEIFANLVETSTLSQVLVM